jgi:hypothetical protein
MDITNALRELEAAGIGFEIICEGPEPICEGHELPAAA